MRMLQTDSQTNTRSTPINANINMQTHFLHLPFLLVPHKLHARNTFTHRHRHFLQRLPHDPHQHHHHPRYGQHTPLSAPPKMLVITAAVTSFTFHNTISPRSRLVILLPWSPSSSTEPELYLTNRSPIHFSYKKGKRFHSTAESRVATAFFY